MERKTEASGTTTDKRFTSVLDSDVKLERGKKKKRWMIFSVLLVAVIAVIVVIVIIATKKGVPSPPGPPDNGTPLDFKEYNPFYLESGNFSE